MLKTKLFQLKTDLRTTFLFKNHQSMKIYLLIISIVLFVSCKENKTEPSTANYQCQTEINNKWLTQNEMTALMSTDVVQKLASPHTIDANGAMSNNKAAYFHVRFQMGVSPLADYAIKISSKEALEMVALSIEYSFNHQLNSGDFELVIPSNMQNITLSEGDKISGVSFYLSSLGITLLAISESSWAVEQSTIINRLNNLHDKFTSALTFLKTQKELLKQFDNDAPNRLFYDALAFYSLGKYLNDNEAKLIGLDFMNVAISKKHAEGYFIEKGGWDSSYQGVGLTVGYKLLTILDSNELQRVKLFEALSCGTNWQISRITGAGEISTQGNTRVYNGGESFLGTPKTVSFSSTIIAFYNLYYLTDIEKYYNKGNLVLSYYN